VRTGFGIEVWNGTPGPRLMSERHAGERRPYEYGVEVRVGSHLVCAPALRLEPAQLRVRDNVHHPFLPRLNGRGYAKPF
jgi:hypothetical protein